MTRKTQPFATVAEKHSSSDVQHHFSHWRRDIYSDHTEKHTEWLTVSLHTYTCSNREERRRDKMPAHTIHVQSSTHKWLTLH